MARAARRGADRGAHAGEWNRPLDRRNVPHLLYGAARCTTSRRHRTATRHGFALQRGPAAVETQDAKDRRWVGTVAFGSNLVSLAQSRSSAGTILNASPPAPSILIALAALRAAS